MLDKSTKVLYDLSDVIGYAGWGSNDKNRHRRFLGFHWLPGAIMTEFVSTNGAHIRAPTRKLEHQRLGLAQTVVRRQPANHDGGLHSGRRHRRVGARR